MRQANEMQSSQKANEKMGFPWAKEVGLAGIQ
jgi:hypothetical protein